MFFKKPKSVASLDSKYLKLCEQAANDSKIFDNFRSLKEYKNILEHVDHDLAKKYYENIKNISSLTNSEIFNICKKLSYIGKPELVKIVDGEIPVSTTSLRYLNVALQIKNEFNQNSFKKVIEIGPGYGGQSIILQEFFDIRKYIYIDLPAVNKLINKFIKANKVNFLYELKTLEQIFIEEEENYDLIISNYAFSELNAELQKQSIDKIINKSKYCYMIINSDSFINNPKYKKIKFMSKEEILNNVNNSYIDEEIPLTSKNNYLLLSKET